MTMTDITEAVHAYFRNTKIHHNEEPVLNGEASGWVQVGQAKETYFTCRLVNGVPINIKAHPNRKPPKPSDKVGIA